MLDLAEFLYQCMKADSVHKWQYKLAVINTDNVPSNGDKILKCVVECDFTTGLAVAQRDAFCAWLEGEHSPRAILEQWVLPVLALEGVRGGRLWLQAITAR